MPTHKRMVAVAIGVRDAKPLRYLPAALNGARAFFSWASALGYEATLVTDETEPVTIARLGAELKAILDEDRRPVDRLLLYFAGHGLIREAEQGMWLLSDWRDSMRAVAVEPLKRRLALRDIKQIAIFSDACRSLPKAMDAADLDPDAVLGNGHGSKSAPEVDKFVAAQDGEAAFAIPGDTEDDDRCVFSGVLIEALWGTQPAAFSRSEEHQITSRSLSKFLKDEVPKIAARYGRKSAPSTVPTFSEGEDVYFEKGQLKTQPTLSAWPLPSSVLGLGQASGGGSASGSLTLGGTTNRLPGHGTAVFSKAAAAPPENAPLTLLKRLRLQPRPQGFDTGSGFAVEGASIRRLWTPARVFAEPQADANWWRVRELSDPRLQQPASILIEFVDGRYAAVAALPNFVATVLCDTRGVSALIYRLAHSPAGASAAESAIDQLERGVLRADSASELAVTLRIDEHVDPVLGVISAYLYDSIGDVDSIRRMAYYYTQHQQPIPYDIALLAQLTGTWNGDLFRATVPPVAERKPRTDAEDKFTWTHAATPTAEGPVGGVWPWLRQGWVFLDDPADDGSSIVLPGLTALTKHLTSGRFATLTTDGAQRLIGMLGLVRRDSP